MYVCRSGKPNKYFLRTKVLYEGKYLRAYDTIEEMWIDTFICIRYETYYNLLDEFRAELKQRGENPLNYHYDNIKIECTITKTK